MKTSGMLIKYYFFCLLMGLIFGFNQYAFKISIPIYITGLASLSILWGLIYSALKECDAEYSKKNLRSATIGIVVPNTLALYLSSSHYGLSGVTALIAAVVSIVVGAFVVWGLFSMSKSMILSIPLDDEYDS